MASCNFTVGMKVVCIRPSGHLEFSCCCNTVPELGQVYTIRQIEKNPANGEIYFRLEEIVNPPRYYAEGYGEYCFHRSWFRPVVERKTDISIFRAMLNKTPEQVPA
ncbi:hypothetical protein ASD54_12435 [Rhizobium sp. Root149]|uniref:hypothetical protein n=1 Tax=Rhizobium sp. Root149 TaxID=1736473 RepID=UPI000715226D|nr:hypothetical protein [Rhizobium sp. Root149]KQZ49739.1 hypothetical protein ASD54_12435 [Rhizobium sp. Root149]